MFCPEGQMLLSEVYLSIDEFIIDMVSDELVAQRLNANVEFTSRIANYYRASAIKSAFNSIVNDAKRLAVTSPSGVTLKISN